MKILFVPNWNGHLHISDKDDDSVRRIFYELKTEHDKIIVETIKNDINKTQELIKKEYVKHLSTDFVLTLNGDHSNTYPLVEEFSKYSEDFKLVIFDAHPDVEEDSGVVSHEDYLRFLIKNKIIKPENIYLFGIRMFSRLELEFLESIGVNYFTIVDILRDKDKINKILESLSGPIYLSVDIDVLDPDDAPGTYYSEHCGLYIEELENFILLIKDKITGADINEYFSEKDIDDKTKNNTIRIMNIFLNQ